MGRYRRNKIKQNKKTYLDECLGDKSTPVVAVSDYVKMVSEQIRPYIPAPYYTLGTDGFGRSDTRENLRHFFEVDRYYITLCAIRSLIIDKKLDSSIAEKAILKYKIDPNKPNPLSL